MELVQRIEQIIADPLLYRGYEVVRVQLSGNVRKQLQVMIENTDERPITVDDCAEASRCISSLFNVEDPIEGAYVLEVSSPGMDRPLVKVKDFVRFVGHPISLKTHNPIEGRKNFQGMLGQASEASIHLVLTQPLASGQAAVEIPYEDIRSAKLHVEF
jgi:ribosome maturation factor RimP